MCKHCHSSSKNEQEFSFSSVEFAIDENMRPRAARTLGVPLEWDVVVDALPPASYKKLAGMFANLCRFYRKLRPQFIGNRCAFEPSCSRYSEMCFRLFGFQKGIVLTMKRLKRCNAQNGGLDLPPDISTKVEEFKEKILCNIV